MTSYRILSEEEAAAEPDEEVWVVEFEVLEVDGVSPLQEVAKGFTSVRLLRLIGYWLLAFKLAGDEVFLKRGPHPQDAEAHRRLHRELFGDALGGEG